MDDLMRVYEECIQRLEQRREELSSHLNYFSKDDVFMRCKTLDEEIEDMYYAINLMRGRIAD